MENKNRPIYPVEVDSKGKGLQTSDYSGMETGLTKREYFSAMAMQGLMACVNHYPDLSKFSEHTAKETATFTIQVADELLKQLEETK